jgi:hypothetical protein
MCKLVPVLRIIGLVLLVIAFLACTIGFIAPFWVRLPIGHQKQQADVNGSTVVPNPSPAGQQQQQQHGGAGDKAAVPVTTHPSPLTTTPKTVDGLTSDASADGAGSGGVGAGGVGDTLMQLLANGSYEGLWAKCYNNLTCSCFWQNDFEMEKQFEVWHQAAQGLFGIGLLVLLVALVTASFHICCCHCCRESFAIATVIGSLIIAGLLLVTFSLAVFGIFSTVKNNVQLTGSVSVFEWAYYVSIGGVGVALLAAILFIVDGCRGPSDSDGDGEETAKMV